MQASPLNQTVFVVEDEKIIEAPIGTFSGFIDQTTTPRGVGPRMHVRGSELWTWGHQGSFPKMVETFETEEAAHRALEATFVFDFWNCADICAFPTREAAEQFIAANA